MFSFRELRAKRKLSRLRKGLKGQTVRSSGQLDQEIAALFVQSCARVAEKASGKDFDRKRIAIMASGLADVGGHTICVKRFAESFAADYELRLFLSDFDRFAADAPATAKHLSTMLETNGVSRAEGKQSPLATCLELFQQLVAFSPAIVIVYIGMHDVIAAGALALLRKYTRIKIIYFNHGDHLYSLGIASSHRVVGPRRSALLALQKARTELSFTVLPLQGLRQEDLVSYPASAITDFRVSCGVGAGELLSLTGCASGKLFSSTSSPYLEMLKELLIAEPKLKHLLLTELTSKQHAIFLEIFSDYEHLLDRLIIRKRLSDFDLALQASDVFIDSFPTGSALVHIDMIRNRRPTVVKINTEDPLFSFEEYMYPGYQYAFRDTSSMKEGIVALLHDKSAQDQCTEKSFQYYLENYEFRSVKEQYRQLIEQMTGASS